MDTAITKPCVSNMNDANTDTLTYDANPDTLTYDRNPVTLPTFGMGSMSLISLSVEADCPYFVANVFKGVQDRLNQYG